MQALAQLLHHSFASFSAQTAVSSGEQKWTYAELKAFAKKVAVEYQRCGLEAGDCLGLLLPKSLPMVGGITAAISSRLTYVPLAPDNPAERIAYIVQDAACDALITTVELAENLRSQLPEYHFEPFLADYLIARPSSKISKDYPQDIAYILYTSGSTGLPKGVLLTHENASCFIEWAATRFSITEKDKIASLAPFHFDLSVFDLFVSLQTGAELCLFTANEARNPRYLAQQLDEQAISVLYTTPSLLQLLNRHGKLPNYGYPTLRLVLFAGEVFPIAPLKAIKQHWPTTEFYNLYGPTETNVVSWHPIPRVVPAEVHSPYPIGKLCPYARAKLRNADQYLNCTPGNAGELMISGPSVSPGYVGKAISYGNHLVEIEGATFYPTGDWVRINENSEMVYLGRTDRMVKRRGYRIELAEIENAILLHEKIQAAAAVAKKEEEGPKIILFLITITGEPLSHPDLKEFLAEHLPLYMSPDKFHFLTEFPLTSSQKIDFQLLKKWSENYV